MLPLVMINARSAELHMYEPTTKKLTEGQRTESMDRLTPDRLFLYQMTGSTFP